MKFYLATIAIFLCGCSTFSSTAGKMYAMLDDNARNLSPDQIEAIGGTVSNTGVALSYFVLAGIILVIIGVVMIAFSVTKKAGIVFVIGGTSCAFTGYIIEEYAFHALIAALGAGLTYGGFSIGNKWGYKLGFENGKDYDK